MTFRVEFSPARYRIRSIPVDDACRVHASSDGARVRLTQAATQQILDALWEVGLRPTGYAAPAPAPATWSPLIKGRRLSDYCSPDLPAAKRGYGTALGYLAKCNPEAVDLMGDLVEETKRDGWWLCHAARKAGAEVITVKAPAVLREAGVERVNAYPVEILKRRFGD